MRALVLGPNVERIREVLPETNCLPYEDPLHHGILAEFDPQVVLSFGYQHVIPASLLRLISVPIFNVHISLLPWNRGRDPNLWSWLENTPRGVSIHWLTAALDRGDLIAQRRLEIDSDQTLRSSYDLLMTRSLDLLTDVWPMILSGHVPRIPQPPGGSYHRGVDKEPHLSALTAGWDTSCKDILEYGRRNGLWLNTNKG